MSERGGRSELVGGEVGGVGEGGERVRGGVGEVRGRDWD